DRELEATRQTMELLNNIGMETVVCMPFKNDGRSFGMEVKPLQQELRDSHMIIAFGGDGTILHLAKMAALRNIPMLGVNLGSLGFISELEENELPMVRELAGWKFATEARMMLDVSVIREGKQVYSNLALNEAVVTKGAVSHVIHLRVFSDESKLTDVKGDGMIVASPTGSTAYSLSAGGPILEPTAQNLVLCPICAHTICFNSYVLTPERVVSIETMDKGKKPVYLSVDVSRSFPLKPGDLVRIKRSRHELKLVRLSGKSFCEIFEKKMAAGGYDDEK
ncbi:MAG: NAD(+)/NADH kinase, partial [Oscillospiraceae bacterium]